MLQRALADRLTRALGAPLGRVTPVGGGSIARAFRVHAGDAVYFVKTGDASVAATFAGEESGLSAMRFVNARAGRPLVVPRVHARAEASPGEPGFLALEWIEPGPRPPGFWEAFGRALARLHDTPPNADGARPEPYGFDIDNHIGATPQRNRWEAEWPTFFREHRLAAQAALARSRGLWATAWDRRFDRLLDRLGDELPRAPAPSLLHGDLWGGNFLCSERGTPALFDPATYVGHREVDLAMTSLFGGFDRRFYAAYEERWPLEPDYARRRTIYNLYHGLNHLNLFGRGYAGMVEGQLAELDGPR